MKSGDFDFSPIFPLGRDLEVQFGCAQASEWPIQTIQIAPEKLDLDIIFFKKVLKYWDIILFVESGKENKFRHRGCSVFRGLKIES